MDYRLSPLQVHELELVLAGAYGADAAYQLPGEPGAEDNSVAIPTLRVDGYDDSTSVTLLDGEATPVARVDVTAVAGADGSAWVAGPVAVLRPLATAPFEDKRPRHRPPARANHAVVEVGGIPEVSAPEQTLIVVVDHGDPDHLARAVNQAGLHGNPVWVLPAPAANHLAEADRPALLEQLARVLYADTIDVVVSAPVRGPGAVVLFTGLSGSGKSTLAQALAHRLRLDGDQRVTLLDGDMVRGMLSSGLGFSREHRELNVRRIGWVASLVAAHGGVAVCAPIAPYASMRTEVRGMAEAVGSFMLVHASTPLEVCEARDRKGLYAKARAGEIATFTGISDPYEEPTDADVVLDTSLMSVDECVDAMMAAWDALPGRGGTR
jgi:adenylyl-sulfate kinase